MHPRWPVRDDQSGTQNFLPLLRFGGEGWGEGANGNQLSYDPLALNLFPRFEREGI